MAPRKRSNAETLPLTATDKIARLLGLLLIKDVQQRSDQVLTLRSAGFETSEIGTMLQMTDNNIQVIEYKNRQKTGKKRKN